MLSFKKPIIKKPMHFYNYTFKNICPNVIPIENTVLLEIVAEGQ